MFVFLSAFALLVLYDKIMFEIFKHEGPRVHATCHARHYFTTARGMLPSCVGYASEAFGEIVSAIVSLYSLTKAEKENFMVLSISVCYNI